MRTIFFLLAMSSAAFGQAPDMHGQTSCCSNGACWMEVGNSCHADPAERVQLGDWQIKFEAGKPPPEECITSGEWHDNTMQLIKPGYTGQVISSDPACPSGLRWKNMR